MTTQLELAAQMQRRYRPGLPPVPPRMWELPIDHRGFPVPWFTPKVNGEWNFQAIAPGKAMQAHKKKTCWICGKRLDKGKTFVIGPMCAINRISSEPPSHRDCARFAAMACPFLTRPRMRRAPTDHEPQAPGMMIDRNPGVSMLWGTDYYKPIDVGNGHLFEIAHATFLECYKEGRIATLEEINESVVTGLPILVDIAIKECVHDGDETAWEEMLRRAKQAWRILKLPGNAVEIICRIRSGLLETSEPTS